MNIDLVSDITALIAAVRAKSWLVAFGLLIRIIGELSSALQLRGEPPHKAALMFAAPADAEDCCKALEAEIGAGRDWSKLLSLLAALLKIVLPLVI